MLACDIQQRKPQNRRRFKVFVLDLHAPPKKSAGNGGGEKGPAAKDDYGGPKTNATRKAIRGRADNLHQKFRLTEKNGAGKNTRTPSHRGTGRPFTFSGMGIHPGKNWGKQENSRVAWE